ncbi:MAG: hypothetical protein MUO53_01480 [Maribacter sp.]|nr:hypothetical protein [Maribacter sp.]
MNRYLSYTLTAPTFDASLGVTNDLINSGKLYLIRNDELRQLISGWSGDIVAATEEELIWRKVRDEAFIPYLKENFSYRNMSIIGAADEKSNKIMNFGRAYEHLSFGPSKIAPQKEIIMFPAELAALENQTTDMLNLNHISKIQMMALKNVVEKILHLIAKEMAPE